MINEVCILKYRFSFIKSQCLGEEICKRLLTAENFISLYTVVLIIICPSFMCLSYVYKIVRYMFIVMNTMIIIGYLARQCWYKLWDRFYDYLFIYLATNRSCISIDIRVICITYSTSWRRIILCFTKQNRLRFNLASFSSRHVSLFFLFLWRDIIAFKHQLSWS
jgi:hypothetical protein